MTNNKEIFNQVPGAPKAFAPDNEINKQRELAAHFLENIVGINPQAAFISDYTLLEDFLVSKKEAYRKIHETYGVDVSDIKSGHLASILKRIASKGGFN